MAYANCTLRRFKGGTGETRHHWEVEKNLAGMACPFCNKKGCIKSCNMWFQAVTQGHKMCGTALFFHIQVTGTLVPKKYPLVLWRY